jgi:hypothetical protein
MNQEKSGNPEKDINFKITFGLQAHDEKFDLRNGDILGKVFLLFRS